jgi:chemotaxis signal transduction protein
MNSQDYLIARIGDLKIGIFCQDVLNVYAQPLRLVKLFYQGRIFRGVANIGGTVMQVIDLRRRIGMSERQQMECLNVITFQTSLQQIYAVIVDEIVAMREIPAASIRKIDPHAIMRADNINLLFPTLALVEGRVVHLMDATYLEKLEPVTEEAGELEFF